MPTAVDLKPVLSFLANLTRNNDRGWFNDHKSDYESAHKVFEDFIDDLIDQFRESDHLQALTSRECIARIYRDIRFSKDKTPYKTNLAALIGPNGWKSSHQGYFISLEPGGKSMVAGGLHEPTPVQLLNFRQSIDRDARPFKRIIQNRDFITVFGNVSGEKLKTAPKGFLMDHPEIGLLQLKQITVMRIFTDREVCSTDFFGHVVHACQTMKPFLDYLKIVD